jgi:hypothetical protein
MLAQPVVEIPARRRVWRLGRKWVAAAVVVGAAGLVVDSGDEDLCLPLSPRVRALVLVLELRSTPGARGTFVRTHGAKAIKWP